jgi:phage host-nuclease inhibitor protein Gam
VDESYRSEIRELNDLNREWLRAELATFRGEVRDEFAAVRAEFRAEFADVRTEFRAEFGNVRGEFATFRVETERRFGQLDARLAEQRAELLKWMFVFWTATVVPLAGLIVALSDVFRS